MTEPTSTPLDGAGHGVGHGSVTDEFADDAAHSGPVVRDRRRLDPQTGKVREAYAGAPTPEPTPEPAPEPGPAPSADSASPGQGSQDLVAAQTRAEELMADLQRLNAEYVNYRKRVERDRDVARDNAVATVLEALLPVLDEVHLARQHGDLEHGPFLSIADKLEATLERFGLARYGEVGEAFDPAVHEALMHTQAELAEDTATTTVVQVLQPGYRAQERILRAARVAVADRVG